LCIARDTQTVIFGATAATQILTFWGRPVLPTHIAKTFAAYIAIAEQDIHRSHFGFPNFFVPFITTTGACMISMT
jgi:hypothetical protein